MFREDEEEEEEEPESDVWISQADAVRTLRRSLAQGKAEFRVSEALEGDILNRINVYPAALETHHQHTIAYLPVNIAKALRTDPGLIQRAVEGFYMRDPAQLRVSREKRPLQSALSMWFDVSSLGTDRQQHGRPASPRRQRRRSSGYQ